MTLGTMKEEEKYCDGFHVFVGLHYWYCGFYAFWLKQVQYLKLTRPHKEVAQGWEIWAKRTVRFAVSLFLHQDRFSVFWSLRQVFSRQNDPKQRKTMWGP